MEAVRLAAAGGLGGMVLKNHHLPTTDRAYHLSDAVEGFRVWGGIALNHAVGGLNPAAVETAIAYEAKVVWMPTIHSRLHLAAFGGDSFPGYEASSPRYGQPISVVDAAGRLHDNLREIVSLISESNVVLATGHLPLDEIHLTFAAARESGVDRLLVTHANWGPTRISVSDQQELVERYDCSIEYSLPPLMGRWQSETPAETLQAARTVGLERVVLVTDGGNFWGPSPAEALRLIISMLLMEGASDQEIQSWAKVNPLRLIDP